MKEQRIINLDHLNILEIVGKGASELLQGQLTCDLEKVKIDLLSWGRFAIPKAGS